jgi:putative ABC transport system substrate-binding protein
MAIGIGRRQFISALGGAAFGWPFVVCAQQPTMPVVGFLHSQSPDPFANLVAAFRQGLGEQGYVEGKNVAIDFRWADRQFERLPALADDLVRHRVDVLVAAGGANFAAKVATATIPIVCTFGGDPVKLGFAASLNRPGGNITGVSVFTSELEAKRLELLHELVPKSALIAVLLDPRFQSGAEAQLQEVQEAARKFGRAIRIVRASTESEIDAAFAELVDMRAGALLVVGSPVFLNQRGQLLALTARHALPAIYETHDFTRAGGLMSYGTNVPEVYRQIGVYTGRILKGEKAADLPILQPTRFDTAINLKTAKALGIEFPTSILLRADEVIE